MPISERALRLRASTDKQIRERWAREAASLPNAPLADKLFGVLNKPLLKHSERQHVSPLGGVAKPREGKR
jgi:hypothetical protein